MTTPKALLVVASLVTAPCLDAEAVLRGRVVDAETRQTIPSTITIRTAAGVTLTDHPSFSGGLRSAGTFTRTVPAGRTTVIVERGFDYGGQRREIETKDGEDLELLFELRRRTPLRKLGWVAGDNHVHMVHGERTIDVSFDYVSLAARAEALDYLSVTNHWNMPEPTPESLDRSCAEAGTQDLLLMWNMEAPKNYWKGNAGQCLGHGWTLGMKGRMADGRDAIQELSAMSAWDYESDKESYPNFEIHALIRGQGGIVSYTHPHRTWQGPWGGRGGYARSEKMLISNMAAELPLDTVIGPTYDTLDIMMHPAERETARRALELWFLLLNHGYRIAATASSDSTFDRPGGGIPGSVRVYSQVDGRVTPAALSKAIKQGRSFVTSGPLVLFDADGRGPGEVLEAGRNKRKLTIRAWASGLYGSELRRVELIRNGVLARTWEPGPGEFVATLEISEGHSAWYIVRCVGARETDIAITNPIYFEGANYRPPRATQARVRGIVTDTDGRPLDGTMEVVQVSGRLAVKTGEFPIVKGKFDSTISPTARLRASVAGFQMLSKSVFMDSPLLQPVLSMTPDRLSDWRTFEDFRRMLADVQLDFRLERR